MQDTRTPGRPPKGPGRGLGPASKLCDRSRAASLGCCSACRALRRVMAAQLKALQQSALSHAPAWACRRPACRRRLLRRQRCYATPTAIPAACNPSAAHWPEVWSSSACRVLQAAQRRAGGCRCRVPSTQPCAGNMLHAQRHAAHGMMHTPPRLRCGMSYKSRR